MDRHIVSSATEFVTRHGDAVIFTWVFVEQIGLPIPSAPVLLAAGTLIGLHRLHLPEVLALAIGACLLCDSIWFCLGKQRGKGILELICHVSFDPETCISKTHTAYSRYGPVSLLFSKFAPGVGALGPPMAGMFGLEAWKFVLLDVAGSIIWAGTFIATGWAFREQIEDLASLLARFGASAGVLVAVALLLYLLNKYVRRQRVFRALQVARITSLELKQLLDEGRAPVIVDLRSKFERQDGIIPGAITVAAGELDSLADGIAEREVVFYCSCPGEVASVQAAVQLRRRGAGHVRPLAGGFAGWRKLGFPVVAIDPGDAGAGPKLTSAAQ